MNDFEWSADASALFDDLSRQAVDHYAERVKQRAIARAPKKTGALAASIEVTVERVEQGRNEAGQFDSTGNYEVSVGSNLDYAAAQEMGARAHLIVAHGPYSLHNAETGQYFGPVVHHPGNAAQPYLRVALTDVQAEAE